MRAIWLVLGLFAASGCAALIYEITWYQLLQLAIGSTSVSLGVLLASFMGGLCLGSYLLPRFADEKLHPLRVYAAIELGIAACGLLVLWLLPLMDQVYFAGVQVGVPSLLLRGVLAALCLLPPTFLMGASLPAISRFVRSSPRAAALWGWLYAGNTLGAVAGALVAAFVLLRLFDVAVASYAAVAINLLVAVASLRLARTTPHAVAAPGNDNVVNLGRGSGEPLWPVTLTIALSGATALGAEVVWTRLLGMMFAATVYAFAIILAVFLAGMAAGSLIAALVLRWVRPRIALGICQILLAGAIAWAAIMIDKVLPFMPAITSLNGWDVAGGDFVRAAMAILPATLLWGASFPLAMAAAADASSDPARPVGRIYAANTLGGIAGALAASLIMIATIGTRDTERVMLLLAAGSGVILLLPRLREPLIGAGVAAVLAASVVLAWTLPDQPGLLVVYGPDLLGLGKDTHMLEVVEGRNSTVAIAKRDDGITEISVSGHVEASDQIADMRLQRMVGHLPALLHPHPVKVLGIGFGAGVSAGSFTRYPTIKSITVCEIEPVIPPTSSRYFARADNNVLHDPRTRIVYDDGRHFMMTTKETFDIIASDPLDVWVKGTASIYTREYFQKVREHLNPGGFFTLYVPLYQSDQAVIKSEIATFFSVFPNGTVWTNTQLGGQGYDMVLMGQVAPLKVDITAVEARLNNPDYSPVAVSLDQIGFDTAKEFYSTFAAQESDLRDWLKGAQLNTDRNLRLMYLAGWSYNADLADPLYQEILDLRQKPTNIFTGGHDDLVMLFGGMKLRAHDPGKARAAGTGE
ncbi:MAG TPA: fused MFS/spermidine synthase [Rhizomicrobium sp.]|nr:fused MFS/spermidine synthase [Rhizomicrobium sp.]